MMRRFQTMALVGAVILGGCAGQVIGQTADSRKMAQVNPAGGEDHASPFARRGLAGKYLSSHFAQSQYDWNVASRYVNDVLAADPGNVELIRRSMILAMGTGNIDLAAQRAKELIALDDDTGLALVILAVKELAANDMGAVQETLAQMPEGDMTGFIKPVLLGWAAAGQGKLDTETLNETTIHLYHGALIATFLNDKDAMIKFTQAMIATGTLSSGDAERAADMLAILGDYEEAKLLYEGVFVQDDSNSRVAEKLAAVKKENGGTIRDLAEPLSVKSVQQGAAMALYDMAYILYQEHSDSSTKLFANMALALDPSLTDAHLLLADTLTRNGRFEDAIAELDNIGPDHPSYLEVQRHAAELLAEAGREKEALEKLNKLFTDHNDIEALIRIGDLYRSNESYGDALQAYNRAAKKIGKTIPEQYWHLLYARGMAYERQGDWNKAEADLKAALVYRPNHPYLLNYLGYGWADQGLNLEESLELIKRAVSLRPTDGYIIDSMGWVQYMMGQYSEALPSLERAVELLPYDTTINDHLGDVYWQVGRQMEARFQWERALNFSEDEKVSERINHKLRFGLEGMKEVKRATAE
ncbi:MAG: tetratricopeptide repeat protein [Rhodospirillales bacterium]|nr:tetratricopeptide repeat protein [Rhodospirillales bacterium]MCB9996955.1 tetratricopeptide repeat protein [Rhodospirillales bacterium]